MNTRRYATHNTYLLNNKNIKENTIMSKKHNNKNNEVEQKSLNNEEYVIEEEAVKEAAEPEVAEGAATEEQSKVVEGEVVDNKKSCKNHHHKKHRQSSKHHNKNHHHKKIDCKKVMKKVGNGAIIATYIASVTAVTCQCLTNPISAVGLVAKECLELHFEKGENKAREEMLRKKIRAEYENAAVVGPAA